VLTGVLLIVTVRRELGIQLLIGERKQRGASLCRPVIASCGLVGDLVGLVGGQKPEWVMRVILWQAWSRIWLGR